jgi:hypothetical protein
VRNTARGVKKVQPPQGRRAGGIGRRETGAEGRERRQKAKRSRRRSTLPKTVGVKTALMADASVDAAASTSHVLLRPCLKGRSRRQRETEAGNIAMREATGYKVDNQLVVKPKS